jgi:hypothetical protein
LWIVFGPDTNGTCPDRIAFGCGGTYLPDKVPLLAFL